MIRPLFFEFPEDPITWNINFEFLWGTKMLIMPVVYPVSIGLETKKFSADGAKSGRAIFELTIF